MGPHWRRVLVVEDNVELASLVARLLPTRQPWRVEAVHSAEEALAWLQVEAADAAIVDLGLPGMSGYELCARMRETFLGPILVWSVADEEHLEQRALACGADGFLAKPSSLDTLASRLKALMLLMERNRRDQAPATTPGAEGGVLILGGILLERRTRRLCVDRGVLPGRSAPVVLTASEACLLEALARVPGKLVCRDELHRVLTGQPWVGRSTRVDYHLHGLRRKLALLGGQAVHGVEIRAAYGEGFVLALER